MSELDNLIDEIIAKYLTEYLTDNLVNIKDVEMGDSVVDYQTSEAKRQINKNEIVYWNTANNIKRRNNL